MKTDRFADSIRRKLDSIRPDFSERDWVRMQAMLKEAGPLPNAMPARPRVFSGQAARLIAAGAAGTVLFLGTTLYQTYELNRLRKSTPQAGQSITRVDSARTITTDTPVANRVDSPSVESPGPRSGEPASPTVIRDTIYIDRYVRVPATPSPERRERLAQSPAATDAQSVETGTSEESLVSERIHTRRQQATSPRQHTGESGTPPVVGIGTASPAVSPADRPTTAHARRDAGTGQATNDRADAGAGRPSTFPAEQSVATRTGNQARTPLGKGDDAMSRVGGKGSGNGTDDPTGSYSAPVAGSTGRAGSRRPESAGDSQLRVEATTPNGTEAVGSSAIASSAIAVAPIQVQPVQLGAVAWEQRLMQRSRRMRPARTVVVGGPVMATASDVKSAPEKPNRQSAPSLVRLRVGAGTDLNGKLWSAGGFAELLAGKHFTFSVGLSQASFNNGKYLTEDDFYYERKTDFRREFKIDSRIIDPRRDLLSIELTTVRLVMPLTLGYRLPVSPTVAITPTVGTILNLQSNEHISFIYKAQAIFPYPNGPNQSLYGSANMRQERLFSVFNNVTLGTTVEWHKKHWGVQAGPMLTISSQPDPDWVSSLSGGIRARAFFQF